MKNNIKLSLSISAIIVMVVLSLNTLIGNPIPPEEDWEPGYEMRRGAECCKCYWTGWATDKCALSIQCCISTHPDCDLEDLNCGAGGAQ